jgi:hypothetical protein
MSHAVEMGSSDMIHIPSFIKIGSGIQNLTGEEYTDTDSIKNVYFHFFFKIRKERLKITILKCFINKYRLKNWWTLF